VIFFTLFSGECHLFQVFQKRKKIAKKWKFFGKLEKQEKPGGKNNEKD
jgi:hypothetical protein